MNDIAMFADESSKYWELKCKSMEFASMNDMYGMQDCRKRCTEFYAMKS
jgi:hypothetical protein